MNAIQDAKKRFFDGRKTAVVGHRGVGKTTLLRRLQTYFSGAGREALLIDLDREIENRAEKTISKIFLEDGEAAFRHFERETFEGLDQKLRDHHGTVFLVCGAGFDPTLIPDAWHVLWVRRGSDNGGRIFTDRPRLDSGVPALEEFLQRVPARDAAYAQRADDVLILNEGLEDVDPAEEAYILDEIRDLGGALTLQGETVRRKDFASWCERRLGWGVSRFELRDDLLSASEIKTALSILPSDRVLVSFRELSRQKETRELIKGKVDLWIDFPTEFLEHDMKMLDLIVGESGQLESQSGALVLSRHARHENESVVGALAKLSAAVTSVRAKFPNVKFILKAALPTQNFDELQEGHAWWSEDPGERSFLPMSSDGRWAWYRLDQIYSARVALSFFREDDGSANDQPSLLDWSRVRQLSQAREPQQIDFAAVLGDPVAHSRTPMEQRKFFAQQNSPVFSIRVTRDEWAGGALDFLQSLGLRWAAVTSPLKELAFAAATIHTDLVTQKLRAANTLTWINEEDAWQATNTDVAGLRAAFAKVDQDLLKAVAVWGGGGVISSVKLVFPRAEFFSVRTGVNRDADGLSADVFNPQTVIWAAPRLTNEMKVPPKKWKPLIVVDLNYAENSPGREYALKVGAVYRSGLDMFRAQAEAQREFWNEDQGEIQ